MSSSSNTDTENLLPKLKLSQIAIPFGVLVLGLIIILFFLLFNQGFSLPDSGTEPSQKTSTEITSDIFIILTFVFVAVGIVALILPNFKENVPKLMEQISNAIFVLIYTICFVIFFLSMSKETLDTYSYIFVPLSMILTGFMFKKGLSSNYIETFNVNYERIKTVILFLCFLTISIVYYSVDPGGLIQKYFGFSVLLTILFAAFSLIFLILMLTIPDKDTGEAATSKTNLLNNFSKFSVYGSISFIIFLIIFMIGVFNFPGGLANNKSMLTSVIIIALLICVIWGTGLVINIFPESIDNTLASSKRSMLTRVMMMMFGVVVSLMFIAWLMYNLQNLSGQSGTISFILNFFVILVFLTLIYKTINVKLPDDTSNSKKNAFFSLLFNIVLYIPCLFSKSVDLAAGKSAADSNLSSIGLLLLCIVLVIIYFNLPSLSRKINLQGGKMLVNKPVSTDEYHSLASYQELNGNTDDFNYQYALSFWVFITPSSMSKDFVSLLNYGEKPNILYQSSTNTIMITMDQKGLEERYKKKKENNLLDFDANGNRIIYKNSNFLLQKWNNIVLNFNGGTLDIFLNNELVKSVVEVVPYMTMDTLSTGTDEENGIKGGICNVVYFNKPLTTTNMFYLYHMVKNSNPPVSEESNETIIKQKI
jgi:cytochrome bd-type quinol oxidase subunit 2